MKALILIFFPIIMLAQEKKENTLDNKDYYIETLIEKSTNVVYDAILNHVDKWWLKTTEKGNKVDDVFNMDFENTYKVFRIKELIESKRIVWECTDAYIDIKTFDVKDEWVGTKLIWELEEKNNKTLMKFTHQGLKPVLECYDVCSKTWVYFLEDSLKSFIETGNGKPY